MSYGYDTKFRERVLTYYDRIGNKVKVCEAFGITRRTLYNWLELREENGDFSLQDRPKVRSSRKITKEKLEAYIEAHPDHFLREIAQEFKVSVSSVFNALKKFRITRKKNDPLR